MRFSRAIGLVTAAVVTISVSSDAQGTPAGGAPRPAAMVLTISGWVDGTQIPAKFTQAGEQVSPELKWTNVPAGTVSFVVNMLDPDVAIQRGTETQPHWIVWNIPGSATGLPEGVPSGGELPDGTRQIRWGRPCRMVPVRSVPAVRSTAAPARRQRGRCTTTPLKCTRSIRSST